MTPSPGSEPGPHWWEACMGGKCSTTQAPSLLSPVSLVGEKRLDGKPEEGHALREAYCTEQASVFHITKYLPQHIADSYITFPSGCSITGTFPTGVKSMNHSGLSFKLMLMRSYSIPLAERTRRTFCIQAK